MIINDLQLSLDAMRCSFCILTLIVVVGNEYQGAKLSGRGEVISGGQLLVKSNLRHETATTFADLQSGITLVKLRTLILPSSLISYMQS